MEKAYALAHLPANRVNDGIAHITELIDDVWRRNEAQREQIQTFGTYLRTQWLPLKDVISVFRKPVRTNNTCENCHLHAARTMGNRPNIWKMLGNIVII